jgi:hypothetical protein
MSDVGHGKPPKEHQFKPGQSGNPGGKSAKQRKDEVKAAEIAARLRLKMLVAMEKEDTPILDRLDPNTLKLFRDSEDRAHGTPKATTEIGGPDGGSIPLSLSIGFKSAD